VLNQLPVPSAILFDVGGTLLEEHRFDLEAGIRAVVGEHPEVVVELAQAFRAELRDHYQTHQELFLAQWLVERLPRLGGAVATTVEDAIWKAVVTLAPRPGIVTFLQQICDDGIPIAAVSNAAFSGRVLTGELGRHGLQPFVQFVLSSADIGVRKPHPAIFEAALSQLGACPERTWFVGDTMKEDIVGASRAGLWPIWLSRDPLSPQVDFPVFQVRDCEELLSLYRSATGRSAEPARAVVGA
jgi:putative hydrolase of the HAD superfamily